MKILPMTTTTKSFHSNGECLSYEDIIECCDSYAAVLTAHQIKDWMEEFDRICNDETSKDYCDFGTATAIFQIDDKNLVIVSDSGGELSSDEFYTFCENNKIDCQFIIDSFDCNDIEVDEIYTGECEDNMEILTLVHKIFN